MDKTSVKRMASFVALPALILFSAANVAMAENAMVSSITLATVPSRIPAVRPDGGIDTPERPGFRVEILRNAGKQCGVDVIFAPVPWARALDMVKNGGADAAFSASYSAERAIYGAYPFRNGLPDRQKAMNTHAYRLYLPADSKLAWDGRSLTGLTRDSRILVERSSAAVSVVVQAGLEPLEVARYPNMVRMLAEKRAAGMVANDTHVNEVLAKEPQLATRIRKLDPPLGSRDGYVMFSRSFYEVNTELVECFWSALGEIRARPAYEALVRSYNNGQFIE